MADQHCLAVTDPNAEYLYCASTAAAVIFSVLFGITTLAHVIQSVAYRKPFCWVVIMGSAWELLGLITRALSTQDQSKRTFYLASSPLVLLAPVWINAFVYMCLARVMHYFLPGVRVLGLRAERVALVFVCGDILAFCVQAAGGGSAVSSDPAVTQRGLWIYTGGIILQQTFILCFFVVAVLLHRDLREKATTERQTNWRVLMWTLYVVLVLITIRIIYRILEFSMGYINYVTTHEVFYFVFDALPMFLALVIFNIWHPAKILVGEDSDFGNGCCGCCGGGRRRSRRLLESRPTAGRAEAGVSPYATEHGRTERQYGYEMVPPFKGHTRGV